VPNLNSLQTEVCTSR